jgi:hypothetical protein
MQKGNLTSGAVFTLPDRENFTLDLGCVLVGPYTSSYPGMDMMKLRFVYSSDSGYKKNLLNWIPLDNLGQMLFDVGIPLSNPYDAVITDVMNAVCTPDPENPYGVGPSVPGILSFDAVIHVLRPTK